MTTSIRFVLIFLIGMAFLIGAKAVVQRVLLERQHTRVSVACDWGELKHLGLLSGATTIDDFLLQVRRRTGLTAVIVDEWTLGSLLKEGKVTVYSGADLINMSRVGASSADRFRADRMYVWMADRGVYDYVRSGLSMQLGTQAVAERVPGIILEVSANWDDLKDLGLGIDAQQVSDLTHKGWGVIARIQSGLRNDRGTLAQKCHLIASLPGVKLVLFEGPSVLGSPGQVSVVADQLRLYRLNYGQVEFFPQSEFEGLISRYPEGLVKVHSIPEAERLKLSPEMALARYVRAVQDRGIRVVVVHPQWGVASPGGIVDSNFRFMAELTRELKAKGYHLGGIGSMFSLDDGRLSLIELLILGLGLGALGLFVLSLFRSLTWWSLGGMTVAVMASLAVLPLALYQWIWGGLGVAVLPAGIVLGILNLHPSRFWVGLLAGLGYLTVGLSLILGMFFSPLWLSGALAFHGIRVALLFPIILVWLYLFVRPHRVMYGAYLLKRWLNTPIRIGTVIGLGLVAVVGVYYVIRSGNGAVVSANELGVRGALESFFGVRPRTKEIFGFMVLFCGFWWQHRPWSKVLLVAGTIGLVSVVNSFCHFYAPLWVSVYRSILGIALGYGLASLVVMGRWVIRMGVVWWNQNR